MQKDIKLYGRSKILKMHFHLFDVIKKLRQLEFYLGTMSTVFTELSLYVR